MEKLLTLLSIVIYSSGYSATDTLTLDSNISKPKQLHGLKHLLSDKKFKSYSIPAICIGYGFFALDNDFLEKTDHLISADMMEDHPNFKTKVDDKLQYAPLAAVYSLNLKGIQSKNNFIGRTAILLISTTVMGNTVDFLKTKTHKLRPNGGGRSFPSGHTATAFVAAEFMRQEFKEVSPWYGFAAYTAAAATGSIRMLKNVHWFSDVVAGAGIGILSAKIGYLTYPLVKKSIRRITGSNILLTPGIYGGKAGYTLIMPLGSYN